MNCLQPSRMLAGLAVALASACAAEQPAEPNSQAGSGAETGAGGLAAKIAALASCGGQAVDPLGQIKTLELRVRDGSSGTLKSVLKNPATQVLSGGKNVASFAQIPAGSPREVTVLGYGPGATKPTWFGRSTGVNIKKNDTTELNMTMMALEGFTCVGTKAMPNALFPASAVIDNGRVLVTGGFTNAVVDGSTVRLESPTDRTYIFDPNTGKFEEKGLLKEARAGHAMIYLAKPNQVLIVGGAKKMLVAADGTAPPQWVATDAANLTYEIYDIATDKFIAGPDNGNNAKKRVFPNLIALTDDYVVSLGGAPWPSNDTDFYAKSDLYEAKHAAGEATGRFKDIGNGLQLNAVRAGAAVAYVAPTANGTARYLIWGGNTLAASPDCASPLPTNFKHAERFKESTEPGTGEFFGDYVLEGDFAADRKPDAPTTLNREMALFFPTLTALGRTTDNGKEAFNFLSVGGIRYAAYADGAKSVCDGGKPLKWLAPSLDDAYILTLIEPTDTTKGRIKTKRVAGLGKGVYLHQANLAGAGAVVLTGGFSTFGGNADFAMQYFDIASSKLLASSSLPAAGQFVQRGGHSGLTLRNDCVFMFGGTGKLTDATLNSGQVATSEVYCPKLLVP